jgi:HSP20 family protein
MARELIRREAAAAAHPIDRLFGQFFRNDPLVGSIGPMLTHAFEDSAFELDVAEDDASVIVRASLPGYAREEIAVDVHDGVVTISASKAEEHEEKRERYYRRERRTGSVSRRIALPVPVKEDAAQAALTDGVLELRLPKNGAHGPRRIAIN